MIPPLPEVTGGNKALRNQSQIIWKIIYVTIMWPVYICCFFLIVSFSCLLTVPLQSGIIVSWGEWLSCSAFLPWDVFVVSYCHIAVFIPSYFSFSVTAQSFVVPTAEQWRVNSNSQQPPSELCMLYTATSFFLTEKHKGNPNIRSPGASFSWAFFIKLNLLKCHHIKFNIPSCDKRWSYTCDILYIRSSGTGGWRVGSSGESMRGDWKHMWLVTVFTAKGSE